MPLGTPSGVQNDEDIYFGQWPRIYAITDPLTAPAEVYFGAVNDGALTTSREEVRYFDTHFPRRLAIVAPVNFEMTFTGRADELRYGLLHYLVGDARIDDASHYVNPGAGCAFEDLDVTLRGERITCDGNMIVFQIHRARASGAIEIGSADDVIGTPIEINALDDTNGTFAGGSASDPLGWIWFSNP